MTQSPAPKADYLALIRAFPLRPLRCAADYDAAVEALDRLSVRDERSLSTGEQDYLDGLTTFVELYDAAHHPTPTADPLALLRELMDQSGKTVTDLGRLFKSKGVASEILRGKRPLTLHRIQQLATFFDIDPAALMPRRTSSLPLQRHRVRGRVA